MRVKFINPKEITKIFYCIPIQAIREITPFTQLSNEILAKYAFIYWPLVIVVSNLEINGTESLVKIGRFPLKSQLNRSRRISYPLVLLEAFSMSNYIETKWLRLKKKSFILVSKCRRLSIMDLLRRKLFWKAACRLLDSSTCTSLQFIILSRTLRKLLES